MIILDIETSGLSPTKNSLLSLGAVDFYSDKEFYGECRVEDDRDVAAQALEINGFNPMEITQRAKTAAQLYLEFYKWTKDNNLIPLLAGQQVGAFDVKFLEDIHGRAYSDLKWIFGHRTVDLHSIAFNRFKTSLSLDGILQSLGLSPEPRPHNALTGAKLEKKAFELLLL